VKIQVFDPMNQIVLIAIYKNRVFCSPQQKCWFVRDAQSGGYLSKCASGATALRNGNIGDEAPDTASVGGIRISSFIDQLDISSHGIAPYSSLAIQKVRTSYRC